VPPAGQFLSTYTTTGQGWQNTAQDSYQLSAKVDYIFNGFTLDSVTAATAWDFHPHNGFTTTPGTSYVYGTGSQIDAKSVTEDIKISNPTGGPVDVTAGLFFLESLLIDHGWTIGGPNSGVFNGPTSYTGLSATQTAAVNNVALNYLSRQAYDNPRTTEIAPYIQDVWHATSNFDITTGLRYSYVYKTSQFSQTENSEQAIPSGFTAAQVADVNSERISANGPNTSWYATTHQGILSAVGTATYKFTPDVFGYGTISQGGRAGGPNPATNLPAAAPKTVAAERLDNFELGIKSSWFDQKLTANLATFLMIDHNYIATGASLLGSTVSTYLANAKRAESRGVELDLRAKPIDGLSLYSSITYDDAYYASFTNSACPFEVTGQSICDLTGKPLSNTPKWTVVVGGEYSSNVGNLFASIVDKPLIAYAGADFTWQSSFYSDETGATTDSIYALIHPYGLLDLHAGIKFEDNSWDLVLWAHNALNKHYYTSIGATTGGEIVATVGEPLVAGVTLRAKF
jgi:iron complex outermembrane receptor protein